MSINIRAKRGYTNLLDLIISPPLLEGISFWEMVERFNANVAYSGLVHAVSQDVSDLIL